MKMGGKVGWWANIGLGFLHILLLVRKFISSTDFTWLWKRNQYPVWQYIDVTMVMACLII